MAMLAEARRKQKISSDPRGNAWRKDGNKFGQKLMEKMGWSEGKGLGAKEDGSVNHVAVSLRQDKRGVGCSKSHVDNWIAHQDDFSALLNQLNESHRGESTPGTQGEKSILKMEEKSRTSKGRLHYQKFTKGKDLSAKTETDLDCVFGKRKSQSGTNTPDVQASSDEAEEPTESSSHGVTTIRSSDSIQEYFARKMAERKNRSAGNSTTNSSDNLYVLDQRENRISSSPGTEAGEDTKDGGETRKKKKSKKNKKKEINNDISLVQRNNDEGMEVPRKVEFVLGEDLENEVTDKKEKKTGKKNKKNNEDVNNEVEDAVLPCEENCESEKKLKKSKKNKRKRELECIDADLERDTEENGLNEDSFTVTKVKKAKKQKRKEKNSD